VLSENLELSLTGSTTTHIL